MNDMKNESRKHTKETAVPLKNLQKQIKNAISGSKLHDTKRKKPAAKTSSGTSLPPQPSGTGTKEQKGSGVGKAFKTKSATNPPPRPVKFCQTCAYDYYDYFASAYIINMQCHYVIFFQSFPSLCMHTQCRSKR